MTDVTDINSAKNELQPAAGLSGVLLNSIPYFERAFGISMDLPISEAMLMTDVISKLLYEIPQAPILKDLVHLFEQADEQRTYKFSLDVGSKSSEDVTTNFFFVLCLDVSLGDEMLDSREIASFTFTEDSLQKGDGKGGFVFALESDPNAFLSDTEAVSKKGSVTRIVSTRDVMTPKPQSKPEPKGFKLKAVPDISSSGTIPPDDLSDIVALGSLCILDSKSDIGCALHDWELLSKECAWWSDSVLDDQDALILPYLLLRDFPAALPELREDAILALSYNWAFSIDENLELQLGVMALMIECCISREVIDLKEKSFTGPVTEKLVTSFTSLLERDIQPTGQDFVEALLCIEDVQKFGIGIEPWEPDIKDGIAPSDMDDFAASNFQGDGLQFSWMLDDEYLVEVSIGLVKGWFACRISSVVDRQDLFVLDIHDFQTVEHEVAISGSLRDLSLEACSNWVRLMNYFAFYFDDWEDDSVFQILMEFSKKMMTSDVRLVKSVEAELELVKK